jgi:hypothetical protein
MKWWEKALFTFIFKTYKLIKHILYKIFIFPFQYIAWKILRFWHKHLHGWRGRYRPIYRQKILVYIFVIFILLCMLKHTQYILYDPGAYDTHMYWPKRIKSLRRLALVHWISYMIIYTVLHILSWIFWQLHYHFKEYGQTIYYEYWFWYSMWYHGLWWDATVKYMNYGYGWTGIMYFTIVNHFFFFSFWGCEFLEEMEYDWDDHFDSYEGAYIEDEETFLHVDNTLMQKLADREQALLDEITWDVFGSTEKIGDDPDKVQARWNIWSLLMYPPRTYNDDDRFEMEFLAFVYEEPWNFAEYYQSLFNERDPEMSKYWFLYWTEMEEEEMDNIGYPIFGGIWFFCLRNLVLNKLPRRRMRAVGEYSRRNTRYAKFLMSYRTFPSYNGYYQSELREVFMLMLFIFHLIRNNLRTWRNTWNNTFRAWDDYWFRKRFVRRIKKLRKWGSKNYSFFGKKNYKPKK